MEVSVAYDPQPNLSQTKAHHVVQRCKNVYNYIQATKQKGFQQYDHQAMQEFTNYTYSNHK